MFATSEDRGGKSYRNNFIDSGYVFFRFCIFFWRFTVKSFLGFKILEYKFGQFLMRSIDKMFFILPELLANYFSKALPFRIYLENTSDIRLGFVDFEWEKFFRISTCRLHKGFISSINVTDLKFYTTSLLSFVFTLKKLS